MARQTKESLIEELKAKGLEFDENDKYQNLSRMLNSDEDTISEGELSTNADEEPVIPDTEPINKEEVVDKVLGHNITVEKGKKPGRPSPSQLNKKCVSRETIEERTRVSKGLVTKVIEICRWKRPNGKTTTTRTLKQVKKTFKTARR